MKHLILQKFPFFITVALTILILKIVYPQLVGLLLLHLGSTKLAQIDQQIGDKSLVDSAINDLRDATVLLPSSALTWRRLAQALQRAGYMDESIRALQQASALGSLLARQELMLTYQTVGWRNEQLEEEFNFDLDRCIAIGDEFLNQGDSVQAKDWYARAVHLWPEQSNKLLFRQWVASAQAGDEESIALINKITPNFTNLSIINLDKPDITVDGSKMHWIPSGEPLNYPHGNGVNAVFWWGGRGSLFIITEEYGDYLVQAEVSNTSPPPIEMAFGVNGKILHQFSLSKGDNSWDVVEFKIRIKSRISTVDFWFLNDEWRPENDIDRNAMIQRIRIVRI